MEEAVREISDSLEVSDPADLALVFVSTYFSSELPRLLPLLRSRLKATHWIGCAGAGVIGTTPKAVAMEIEREPSISVAMLNLPGAQISTFTLDMADIPDLDGPASIWQDWIGCTSQQKDSMLLFVDPGSRQINDLISGLDYAYPSSIILGGIAAPHNASHGSLLNGNGVFTGAVGCVIGGEWTFEAVVSKGCKPIGPVFEVEQVQKNVLLELSHNDKKDTPVSFLQSVLEDLSEKDRDLVKDSLFLGVEHRDLVISGSGVPQYQSSFVVRNLIGVDPSNGAVAVAERMHIGQNVQFQLREPDISRQEAHQLLFASKERSSTQPIFGLLIDCLGRGESLYGAKDGDVDIARNVMGDFPIAGVFSHGEIGPSGGTTDIHAYTACWGLLRPTSKQN